jgi:hypothetical protein
MVYYKEANEKGIPNWQTRSKKPYPAFIKWTFVARALTLRFDEMIHVNNKFLKYGELYFPSDKELLFNK